MDATRTADSITQRMQVEREILGYVVAGMRLALGMPLGAESAGDWLDRVRFQSESLRRHVGRLRQVEEQGGCLQFAVEWQPDEGLAPDETRRRHELLADD